VRQLPLFSPLFAGFLYSQKIFIINNKKNLAHSKKGMGKVNKQPVNYCMKLYIIPKKLLICITVNFYE
jgi:hypothetical protein